MGRMRGIILSLLIAIPALAGWGNFHTETHDIVVGRYTNHDFNEIVKPFLPPPPVPMDGALVQVRIKDPSVTKSDAFRVTLRYRDLVTGKVYSRTQTIIRERTLDATGAEVYSLQVFLIGPSVEPLSIIVRDEVWESVEETETQ